MSLVSLMSRTGPTGFGYASTAEQVTAGLDLAGKTVLITGCNSGIGRETLRVLASRGAHVIAAARSREKAEAACREVGAADATPVACELADPRSVLACVEAVAALGRPLDAIVANAGIMALPKLQQAHDYELQFFTNHIGHFLLVTRLVDRLADQGRVVMLSSSAHQLAPPGGVAFDNLSGEQGYVPWRAYGQSKMANLLFAKALARRFAGSGRMAAAVHPGVILTELQRHMMPGSRMVRSAVSALGRALFMKSIPQGAATQCYLAAHPDGGRFSGAYFADVNVAKPRAEADDPAIAERLWAVSERILAEVGAA
jgi:WW domain-containing oxidoreductase